MPETDPVISAYRMNHIAKKKEGYHAGTRANITVQWNRIEGLDLTP